MNRINLFMVLVLTFGAICDTSARPGEMGTSKQKSALMNTNIALVNADPHTTKKTSSKYDVLIDPSNLVDQATLDRQSAEFIQEDSRDRFLFTASGKPRPRLQTGPDADYWADDKPKFAYAARPIAAASNVPLSRSKRGVQTVGCGNRDDDDGDANRARGWRNGSRGSRRSRSNRWTQRRAEHINQADAVSPTYAIVHPLAQQAKLVNGGYQVVPQPHQPVYIHYRQPDASVQALPGGSTIYQAQASPAGSTVQYVQQLPSSGTQTVLQPGQTNVYQQQPAGETFVPQQQPSLIASPATPAQMPTVTTKST